jgi:hypothetical protein
MCLMQPLSNYEIPICNQCHSTPIASLLTSHSLACYQSGSYLWTHDMVANENSFRKGSLEVKE